MTLPQIKPDSAGLEDLRDLFLSSLSEVFKKQFDLDSKKIQSFSVVDCKLPANLEIASSLSVTSAEITGTLSLMFPGAVFLKLASTVFGSEFKEINEENRDLAAEILNMSFGMTKTKFSDSKSIVLQPAIPMIVQGEGVKLTLPKSNPTWITVCEVPSGRFLVVTSFHWEGSKA